MKRKITIEFEIIDNDDDTTVAQHLAGPAGYRILAAVRGELRRQRKYGELSDETREALSRIETALHEGLGYYNIPDDWTAGG